MFLEFTFSFLKFPLYFFGKTETKISIIIFKYSIIFLSFSIFIYAKIIQPLTLVIHFAGARIKVAHSARQLKTLLNTEKCVVSRAFISLLTWLFLTWRRNAHATPSPALAGYQLVDFPTLHYESLSCWSTTAIPLFPLHRLRVTRKMAFRQIFFFLLSWTSILYTSYFSFLNWFRKYT